MWTYVLMCWYLKMLRYKFFFCSPQQKFLYRDRFIIKLKSLLIKTHDSWWKKYPNSNCLPYQHQLWGVWVIYVKIALIILPLRLSLVYFLLYLGFFISFLVTGHYTQGLAIFYDSRVPPVRASNHQYKSAYVGPSHWARDQKCSALWVNPNIFRNHKYKFWLCGIHP